MNIITPKFEVTEKAMRPASPERKCFYCRQPVGECHKDTCVLVRKRVMVRLTIEYPLTFPADWTAHDIEFNLNDGSSCSNNLIQDLDKYREELEKEGQCFCHIPCEFKYLEDTSEPFLSE